MSVSVFAPAKVNLYLHVTGRRDDGYHLLDSLFAFADIGDRVSARPAERFSLSVDGPEGAAIADLGGDNLVLRAARWLASRAGITNGAALHLDKHLPPASGIGGGSADAAATLRALSQLWDRPLDREMIIASAELGADVPACIASRPVWVGGIGEQLRPASGVPPLGIVFANPRCSLSTPAVFRARHGPFSIAARFSPMPSDPVSLAVVLAERRNDLTEAAISIQPEIAIVLERLGTLPGTLLTRMSGSGATCFALFRDRDTAVHASRALAADRPEWWCAAGSLLSEKAGGP